LGAEDRRLKALEHVREPAGTELGLALLLGPSPEELDRLETSLGLLDRLKVSRNTHTVVLDAWRLASELQSASALSRATRLRAMRRPGFDAALAWLTAWWSAEARDGARWEELVAERAASSPTEIVPAKLVEPADLARLGVAPGPAYGAILRDLETEQLELRVRTRDEALAWLAARVAP